MASARDLYARWAHEMRRGGHLRAGDRVGVAVSGGPDSVLLLELMNQLSPSMGLVVSAVHFNHRLRGAESEEDERFVSDLAARLGVGFIRGDSDVARRAKEQKRNLEATARELRYKFFLSLIRAGRLDKVATAHTANDQAETVLLRILRGTGTKGLAGIYPVLDGVIVRPFLALTRAEIEAEIERRHLAYRVDSSNLNLKFRRNKIRKELLPLIQREFSPDIVSVLVGLADRARRDEEYLGLQAHDRAAPWRVKEGKEEKIPARALVELPPSLAMRVIRQMILAVKGRLAGITQKQLESVYRLATDSQSGRRTILPGNVEARREFEWLIIAPQNQPEEAGYAFTFQPPAEFALPQAGIRLVFKIVERAPAQRAYNEQEAASLDAGILAGQLELRNWRPGDCFAIQSGRKPVKLKELFRRQKIGVASRGSWPVLVSAGKIVWVRGMPVASPFTPGKNTRAVLIIREEPLRNANSY